MKDVDSRCLSPDQMKTLQTRPAALCGPVILLDSIGITIWKIYCICLYWIWGSKHSVWSKSHHWWMIKLRRTPAHRPAVWLSRCSFTDLRTKKIFCELKCVFLKSSFFEFCLEKKGAVCSREGWGVWWWGWGGGGFKGKTNGNEDRTVGAWALLMDHVPSSGVVDLAFFWLWCRGAVITCSERREGPEKTADREE